MESSLSAAPYIATISAQLNLRPAQVAACAKLLEDEATVPFIARYRKEATGGLDEVAIEGVRDKLALLRDLAERRQAILGSLEKRELLSPELKERLEAAQTLPELEDVYLPLKPKARSRAMAAKEKGLLPLAEKLIDQEATLDPLREAAALVASVPEAQGLTPEEALQGARDILAEIFNEDAAIRAQARALFAREAILRYRVIPGMEEEGKNYRDYFDGEMEASKVPSHRFLAIRRGESKGVLTYKILPPPERALAIMENAVIRDPLSPAFPHLKEAIADSYQRLLRGSLETEARIVARKKAEIEAARNFAENVREILMAPPWGPRAILAVDPGYRTGCKAVALGADASVLACQTVFLQASDAAREEAAAIVAELIQKYELTAAAVGSGKGGKEMEMFIRELPGLPADFQVLLVPETGASIYSASPEARQEFPHLDLTYRGAISIGRRLIDPLAELVKIDPKSLGVGLYQYDVDPKLLDRGLEDVVVSCVNQVGVEINSASEKLLSFVSGLSPSLAHSIVAYRQENGPFQSRQDFLKVPRLGPKTFEQCAGFLRVRGAQNPLDASAVHPESYFVVEKMAADLGVEVQNLMGDPELRAKVDRERYLSDSIGLPTIRDIFQELEKPGRDPRPVLVPLNFDRSLSSIADVQIGSILTGLVTNVTNFGAFVDLGIETQGLIHISDMSDSFVTNTHDIVRSGQEVLVRVNSVDMERGRIALSLRLDGKSGFKRPPNSPGPKGGPIGKPRGPKPFNNPFNTLQGKF
ncbi:MAG: RNA-binding transcriptional accessory protein [Deltaproteobacteria bacterium]|nr:RNA-binding transcriptional accessory protein [Deltaproteobacteria bacterium]